MSHSRGFMGKLGLRPCYRKQNVQEKVQSFLTEGQPWNVMIFLREIIKFWTKNNS